MGIGSTSHEPTVLTRYTCRECGGGVAIDAPAGKDYDFEETVRYGNQILEELCNWAVVKGYLYCSTCRVAAELDGARDGT